MDPAVPRDSPRRRRRPSLAAVAPGLAALLHYDRSAARYNLIAGFTVGLVAVPSALAMGELAGVPVQFGLYATLFPLAAYGLLATSRQHVIGPDAALSALTAATLAPLATVDGAVDPALYAVLAAGLAIAMGGLLVLAGVLHLGFIGDFFGKPVLLGYINGVAVIVIFGQLEKLLGITVDANDFVPMVEETVGDLGDLNGSTVLLSLGLLAIALAVRRFVPGFPASIAVLVAALGVATLFDVGDWDIATVGDVEGGLPPVGIPDVTLSQLTELLLPASAFGLIAFADTAATVRTFAQRHHYEVDANRELTALGTANVLSGLTSAFPVSSSNSRSAVNDATGARTQASALVAAVVVGLCLLFLMPLIEPLPKAALGVVIVIAASGLIDVRSIWSLRHIRSAEVGLAVAAFVGAWSSACSAASRSRSRSRSGCSSTVPPGPTTRCSATSTISTATTTSARSGCRVDSRSARIPLRRTTVLRQRRIPEAARARPRRGGRRPRLARPERRGMDVRRCDGDRHALGAAVGTGRPRHHARLRPPQGPPARHLLADRAHRSSRGRLLLPHRPDRGDRL